MITIFHGDNLAVSRTAFSQHLDQLKNYEILKLDSKTINPDQINNFLHGGSLFVGQKALAISNFFSIPKANLDKLIKLIISSDIDIVLWQDKPHNATQLKTFPKPDIHQYKADNQLYSCLNALKPKNLKLFIPLYEQVIKQDLFDLFLYLLKGSLRRQLQTYSKFNQTVLLKTYLQLIELEYQYKTGQLSLPKELALKRVLVAILK